MQKPLNEHEEPVTINNKEGQQNENTYKDLISEFLSPSSEDAARQSVSMVFREEGTKINSEFLALTRARQKLVTDMYEKIQRINDVIFSPERFGTLTNKELLYALTTHYKALAALSIPLEEINNVSKQITLHVEQAMKDDNKFADIAPSSRRRIKDFVENVLLKTVAGESDIDMLNSDIKENTKKLHNESQQLLDMKNKFSNNGKKDIDLDAI